MTRLKHLAIQLFLLQLSELFVQLVLVEPLRCVALREGLGDLFAYRVLLPEVLPAVLLVSAAASAPY